MADNSWVKVYRKITEKGYYKKSHYVHLWLHLLLKASHKETEFMWNGKIEKLMPGQFVTGRNQLSSDTGIPPSTVEDILNLFETEQQIRQQKNNKFRLLTVLNWQDYQEKQQQKQQQGDSQPTTEQQQSDTFKNIKNVRMKEIKSIPPDMEELKLHIKEKKYNIDPEKFFAYYESNGWMVGKNKMKSWKAALVTWNKSDYNSKPKQSSAFGNMRQSVTLVHDNCKSAKEKLIKNIEFLESHGEELDVQAKGNLDRWRKELKELENDTTINDDEDEKNK